MHFPTAFLCVCSSGVENCQGTAGKLAARKQRVAQAFENCESSVIILLIYTVQYMQYFVDMYSVT